jgi:diguanylate cyclase (GGDEF)-like protein
MHAGADDFIAKPVDPDELRVHLEAARRIVMLHRQLDERHASLQSESERARGGARTDSLTGALNRLALDEDLETMVAQAARYGHKYRAALCEIDQFDAYRDHFGHLRADDVLRRVAGAIHGGLRRGDVFYRYGGAALLVILPEQGLAQATLVMDRVRGEVERLQLPCAPGAALPFVSISVGISSLRTETLGAADDWLRRSAAALRVAKAGGTNRVSTGGE